MPHIPPHIDPELAAWARANIRPARLIGDPRALRAAALAPRLPAPRLPGTGTLVVGGLVFLGLGVVGVFAGREVKKWWKRRKKREAGMDALAAPYSGYDALAGVDG